MADGACGILALSGEDGDVLETAEGAEEHLAKEGERDHIGLRELQGEWLVMDRLVARNSPERKDDQCAIDDEDGDSADVVDPFAEFEAADGGGSDGKDDRGDDGEGGEVVFRKPCGGGADEVRELGGNGVEDRGGDGDAVEPEIPGGHEAAEIAECGACPDVEAAFKGHLAVEVDDGYRHGQVEEDHGGDPSQCLGAAEAGGDSHPGAADDAEHLREDKIAETELAVEAGLWSGRS